MQTAIVPIVLLFGSLVGLALTLFVLARLIGPRRGGRVKEMPYESGMDPVHDTRRRFLVRFHLVAIAFLVFDVELLFLYPWAVAFQPGVPKLATVVPAEQAVAAADAAPSRPEYLFAGGMVFLLLVVLGFVYDWRKGVFEWR